MVLQLLWLRISLLSLLATIDDGSGNAGGIAGGVVGGIAVLLIILFSFLIVFYLFYVQKRKKGTYVCT